MVGSPGPCRLSLMYMDAELPFSYITCFRCLGNRRRCLPYVPLADWDPCKQTFGSRPSSLQWRHHSGDHHMVSRIRFSSMRNLGLRPACIGCFFLVRMWCKARTCSFSRSIRSWFVLATRIGVNKRLVSSRKSYPQGRVGNMTSTSW